MEDEEEDLPLLPHCCGTSCTVGVEAEANRSENDNEAPNATMPPLQTTPCRRVMTPTSDLTAPFGTSRSLQGAMGLGIVSAQSEETTAFLHSLIFFRDGNPELSAHSLGISEPPSAVARPQDEEVEEEEEQGEGRAEEKEEGDEAGPSVEVQIGRKLRQIGDQFQHDHLQQFLQDQAVELPGWLRMALTVFNLLFPRAAPAPDGEGR